MLLRYFSFQRWASSLIQGIREGRTQRGQCIGRERTRQTNLYRDRQVIGNGLGQHFDLSRVRVGLSRI
jgi:hypothetical protein